MRGICVTGRWAKVVVALWAGVVGWCGVGWVAADTVPTQGLVNYETAHGHPLELAGGGTTLLAVNTAAHALEVFSLVDGVPVPSATIAVGMDPVSVRARTATEAWVVNQLSDSVSVVDLTRQVVVATLSTANEPADVIFAGLPERAFVSCGDANRVLVFDPARLEAAPVAVAIAGEEPRALAASADRSRVYVALFESGNGSTVLHGRPGAAANVVSRPEGPHAGQNPPPNAGAAFVPPIGAGVGLPPQVSLIVRQRADGRWTDDNQGDWTSFVTGELASVSGRVPGWQLPDNDVGIIDAATLEVTYQRSLMTTVMAVAVHPTTGRVSVVGTDAQNDIRWEPNLNGRFLRVNMASFSPGDAATIHDLNPHLDYQSPAVPAPVRTQSLGDPRGVVWRADGSRALVTGMGSNSVAVVGVAGDRLGHIPVGEGPTGIVIDEAGNRAYVLNRFGASVSVIDLAASQETARISYYDPTPDVIKAGRPFLYNTHRASGLGHVSCASCHIDARTDRLAWDLGDPSGTNVTVAAASNATGAPTGGRVTVSAMKGPMVTQTLQDIGRHPSLHWRGDMGTFAEFNDAFASLLGAEQPLSAAEMDTFKAFLDTIHLPPNPYRAVDNSRPSTVVLPDGSTVRSATMNSLRGQNSRANNCLKCHLGAATRNRASNSELGQAFVAPALSLFYKKLGYWPKSLQGSTSGTGFFHDGVDSVLRAARVNTAESQPDMLAEILTLEGPAGPLAGNERRLDTHGGVGRQLTLRGPATTPQLSFLQQMITIAVDSPHASLVAHTRLAGVPRSYFLADPTTFQSDRTGEKRTTTQLVAQAATDEPVSFMLVAQGTALRLSVDRDGDGAYDRDGLTLASPGAQTSALATPVVLALSAITSSAPVTWSATGLPPGLALDAVTGVINGTPTLAGRFTVTVGARDAAARIASQSFDWTIDPPQSTADNGLAAAYFAGRQFDSLRLTRFDPELNVFWPGLTAPGPGMPGDDFSVRWTGRLQPAFSETYTFVVDCDDGVRLWIDGRLILDHWDREPSTYFGLVSEPVSLTAGKMHDIRVELQDVFSDAWLVVKWQSASQARQVVPSTRLFRPGVLDTTPPTVTLSTAGTTVPGPFAVTLVFSEMVSGLDLEDLVVGNGSVSSLTGAGVTFTAVVTPARSGVVTVALPSGRVTDAAGLTNADTGPLSVEFLPEGANQAPVVAVPTARTTVRGSPVTLLVEAYDPDGRNLVFSATGLPDGLVLNSSTGLISGIVRHDAPAQQTVTVTASDGILATSVSFAWNTTQGVEPPRGLVGEYFAGSQFNERVISRVDPRLQFLWPGDQSPAPGVPGDQFSVRWNGRLLPSTSESHRFVINGDDGVRLWVNGQLLLDHWDPVPSTYFGLQSLPITLTAGRLADLRVELQDFYSDAWLEVYWSSASRPLELIPDDRMFQPDGGGEGAWVSPRATGLRAAYFRGRFGEPVVERIDPNINFAWGLGAPAVGLPVDQFSVRWDGWLLPSVDGVHRLHMAADGAVRMTINEAVVIDAWADETGMRDRVGEVDLRAGVPVRLRLEWYHALGAAGAELSWSMPGRKREIVPQERLSPEAGVWSGVWVSDEEAAVLAATRDPAALLLARSSLPMVGRSLRVLTDPQGGWVVSYDRPPGLGGVWLMEASADLLRWDSSEEPGSVSLNATGAENVRLDVPGAGDEGAGHRFFRVRVR